MCTVCESLCVVVLKPMSPVTSGELQDFTDRTKLEEIQMSMSIPAECNNHLNVIYSLLKFTCLTPKDLQYKAHNHLTACALKHTVPFCLSVCTVSGLAHIFSQS